MEWAPRWPRPPVAVWHALRANTLLALGMTAGGGLLRRLTVRFHSNQNGQMAATGTMMCPGCKRLIDGSAALCPHCRMQFRAQAPGLPVAPPLKAPLIPPPAPPVIFGPTAPRMQAPKAGSRQAILIAAGVGVLVCGLIAKAAVSSSAEKRRANDEMVGTWRVTYAGGHPFPCRFDLTFNPDGTGRLSYTMTEEYRNILAADPYHTRDSYAQEVDIGIGVGTGIGGSVGGGLSGGNGTVQTGGALELQVNGFAGDVIGGSGSVNIGEGTTCPTGGFSGGGGRLGPTEAVGISVGIDGSYTVKLFNIYDAYAYVRNALRNPLS